MPSAVLPISRSPIEYFHFYTNNKFRSIPVPMTMAESTIQLQDRTIQLLNASPQELSTTWINLFTEFEQLIQLKEQDSKTLTDLRNKISQLKRLFYYAQEKRAIDPAQFMEAAKIPDSFTKQGFDAWVKELASIPDPIPVDKMRSVARTNVVTHFLPTISYIFMRSFTLLDSLRPPATLYEFGVIVTLYFHFFKLPYNYVAAWTALAPTVGIGAIAAVTTLAAAIAGVYIYMRWFRKSPDRIDFCLPMDQANRPAMIHNHSAARSYDHLIVQGKHGSGKTEWLREYAATLKALGKKVFVVQNPLVFGNTSHGQNTSEKLWEVLNQAKGWEDVYVFVDELGDAFTGSDELTEAALSATAHISSALKINPNIRIVAAMTDKQWEALQKRDDALAGRFKAIALPESTPEIIECVLHHFIDQHAPDMAIDESALQKIVEITDKEKGNQPRKAVLLLGAVIKWVRHQILDCGNSAVQNAELKLRVLEARKKRSDSPLNQPHTEGGRQFILDLQKAREGVEIEKARAKAQQEMAVAMQDLLKERELSLERRNLSARRWNPEVEEGNLKATILFENLLQAKIIEIARMNKVTNAITPEVVEKFLATSESPIIPEMPTPTPSLKDNWAWNI